jgi:DNA polymerase III epsilon subunit-like protein
MKILSVDIETGGLNIECSLLEIVAVCWESDDNSEVCFHRIIRPSLLTVEKDAYDMHVTNGLLADVFGQFSISTEQVAKEFKRWLFNTYKGKLATVVGCNFSSFDGPRILKHLKIKPFWNHRVIDVKQLWMLPSDDGIPTMEACLRRSGVVPPTNEHRAMEDAITALDLFKAWRNQ